MTANESSKPCANGCHSATDAHVLMNITGAKPSDSDCELPTMPTMQQCDGICGEIYSMDQLTKFPCLHVLCGICLNECSLVERDGKLLCPMRECKYLSSTALRVHQQQSTAILSDKDNDGKESHREAIFVQHIQKSKFHAKYCEAKNHSKKDFDSSSAVLMAKSHTSKLSESESDKEGKDSN